MKQPFPTQSLVAILTDLSTVLQSLATRQKPPIPLDLELDLAERARQSASEPQAFRVLEMLIRAAHTAGLTKEPELQHTPAYHDAVQVLRMGDIALPDDL